MPMNNPYERLRGSLGRSGFSAARCLLLPRGQMPLNIFEPRYIAMTDMAIATHRLIGMIQPMTRARKAERRACTPSAALAASRNSPRQAMAATSSL